jgi:hypothetical protein
MEYTFGLWLIQPSGSIRSDGETVDLRSDLGIRDQKRHLYYKLTFKPGRKHRLLLESIPYDIKGENTIDRPLTFGGREYAIREQIGSRAKMRYLFGGYQYDVVKRDQGHAGVLLGVGYFDAQVMATSERAAGAEQGKIPMPMVGGEFRAYPIPGSDWLNFNGEVKGMSLGSYGRYINSTLNLGLTLGGRLTFQAGYTLVDFDIHEKDQSQAFKMRFNGPIFSLQLRDR